MKHESRIIPWPWLHYFIVQVLLKGPSPLSLYQSLPSLTGNISVATVHVRLPIPTLNAAVNNICQRIGGMYSIHQVIVMYLFYYVYTKIRLNLSSAGNESNSVPGWGAAAITARRGQAAPTRLIPSSSWRTLSRKIKQCLMRSIRYSIVIIILWFSFSTQINSLIHLVISWRLCGGGDGE